MTVNRKGLSKDADLLESLGNIEDTSVIDSTASASIIAALKGIIKQLQGGGSGAADVDVSDRAARDLGKVDVATFDVVGQAAMVASVPVVVASDQSDLSTQGGYTTTTATIALDGSLSTEIDITGYKFAIFFLPAAWTAANLSIQAAIASGGTFVDLLSDGVRVEVTGCAASTAVAISFDAAALAACRFIKLESTDTTDTDTPVAQAAERVITVALKG